MPGEFKIKTYLRGNPITVRDGGNHTRDALITSATDTGRHEILRLRSPANEPGFTLITTAFQYHVTAVDGGGATAAAAAFDTTISEGDGYTANALFDFRRLPNDAVYTNSSRRSRRGSTPRERGLDRLHRAVRVRAVSPVAPRVM
jgi:hypothetical protein